MTSNEFTETTNVASSINETVLSHAVDVKERSEYTNSATPEEGQVVPGTKDKGSVWLVYSPKMNLNIVDSSTGR